jgi:hypothetical protein
MPERKTMKFSRMLNVVDAHAEGESGKVVAGGVGPVPGETMFHNWTSGTPVNPLIPGITNISFTGPLTREEGPDGKEVLRSTKRCDRFAGRLDRSLGAEGAHQLQFGGTAHTRDLGPGSLGQLHRVAPDPA